MGVLFLPIYKVIHKAFTWSGAQRKRRFQMVQAAVRAAQSVGPFELVGAMVLNELGVWACCTEPVQAWAAASQQRPMVVVLLLL